MGGDEEEVPPLTSRSIRLVAAAFLVAASAGAAWAHDFTFTDVSIEVDRAAFRVRMIADLDALALGVSPATESALLAEELQALAPEELQDVAERTRELFRRRVRVRFDGEAQPFDVRFPHLGAAVAPGAEPSVFGTVAELTGAVPPGAREIAFGASRAFGPVLLTIERAGGDGRISHTLEPGGEAPPFPLAGAVAAPSRLAVAWRYLVLGFEHILPLGVDHILFVLGLFLLRAEWRPLLWQVSAFTVAHTLSLALSMQGVVDLPSRLVESLIALSIVYVAIENLVTREMKPWRPAVVFAFGLLHGLGFAGVLRELGLPDGEFVTALVSFNCGVELGQVAVLALAFLCVGVFRERRWYRALVVVPASLAIASVGLVWVVQRASGGG